MTTKQTLKDSYAQEMTALRERSLAGMETMLGSAVPGLEAAMAAGARCQSVFMCLASQRLQEYMRIPEKLGACHSPQELAAAQIAFWQTAWRQYSEAGQQAMALDPLATARPAFERDTITFSEPSEPDSHPRPGSRRAA